jgi:protein-disulfide reductase (glutathione)
MISTPSKRNATVSARRAVFIVCVFALLIAGGTADGFNAKRIAWVEWDKAVDTAKRLDKPVMMVVHKTWCAACKQLRQKFVGSAEIEVLSQHFVMANVEDEDEPADEKYSPQGGYSPRIMFLHANGEVADVVNTHGDPTHLHFYGTAEEVVRGMLAALRTIRNVHEVDDL